MWSQVEVALYKVDKISYFSLPHSEKEEDDNEKREDPGDNWEEGGGGGGGGGVEKSSGPWNKTAPVQAPPAPVIGNLNISFL